MFWAAIVAIHLTGQLVFAEVTSRLVSGPLCSLYLFLLLVGFGIKLGMMPLHFALPLAYWSTPIPAGVVLKRGDRQSGVARLDAFRAGRRNGDAGIGCDLDRTGYGIDIHRCFDRVNPAESENRVGIFQRQSNGGPARRTRRSCTSHHSPWRLTRKSGGV